jgi:hypothetical protein
MKFITEFKRRFPNFLLGFFIDRTVSIVADGPRNRGYGYADPFGDIFKLSQSISSYCKIWNQIFRYY